MSNKVKNSILVSFIIPSYNSAQTVVRCLDSIYALSLKQEEYEVIFIDDCSTDNTCDIVETYSQPFPKGKGVANLMLHRQPKNNRQGAARNKGVNVAKGEYICFVDSDDAVKEGMVSAIRMAKEKNADMIAFHYANANDQGDIITEATRLSYTEGQIFTGIEMQNAHPYWCSGPVPYVYNKDFLKRVKYPFREGVLYEDSDFVAVHLFYAQRMAYSSNLGYIAYYREGSTTHLTTYKNISDYMFLGTRMLAFYEKIMDERLTNEMMSELENDGVNQFVEGILEGACWNLEKACRYLIKLDDLKAARAFYDRVDANVNRHVLYSDKRLHKYYWNTWTTLCIKYKYIAIMVLAFSMPMYKLLKR